MLAFAILVLDYVPFFSRPPYLCICPLAISSLHLFIFIISHMLDVGGCSFFFLFQIDIPPSCSASPPILHYHPHTPLPFLLLIIITIQA
jgi:hypothetical protein